jgi:hypothetical protein
MRYRRLEDKRQRGNLYLRFSTYIKSWHSCANIILPCSTLLPSNILCFRILLSLAGRTLFLHPYPRGFCPHQSTSNQGPRCAKACISHLRESSKMDVCGLHLVGQVPSVKPGWRLEHTPAIIICVCASRCWLAACLTRACMYVRAAAGIISAILQFLSRSRPASRLS